MADEPERKAQIKLSTELLAKFLDLPNHLCIVEVKQTALDVECEMLTIVVTGPLCPSCAPGEAPPMIEPRYRGVDGMVAKLEYISGLDT